MKIGLIDIDKNEYNNALPLFSKGCNIMTEGMDYLEFYGALCLANAMGVPIEKIHISDIDDIYSRARNIRTELPCEMEFAGIHFTLVDNAA